MFDSTAIFCRPHQFSEAAVALSCFSSVTSLLPLFVLERPPVTRANYDALYTAFESARRKSMANVNAYRFGEDDVSPDLGRARADVEAHTAARQALTAPRSWLIHNLRVSELVHEIGCSRAIFLFEPEPEDLELWGIRAADPERLQSLKELSATPLLPPGVQIVRLASSIAVSGEAVGGEQRQIHELHELVRSCQQIVGDAAPRAADVPFLPRDVPGTLLALRRALSTGACLRPCADLPALDGPCHFCDAVDAQEAVLVEALELASSIVGVLYAHHSNARLIVSPTMRVAPIDEAVESFAKQKIAAAKALGYAARHRSELTSLTDDELDALSKHGGGVPTADEMPGDDLKSSGLIDRLRAWLRDDWRVAAIERIQRAISDPLPEVILDWVGDLPVTAFTEGVPYNFVRKGIRHWGQKPIALVPVDHSLIVFRSIYWTTLTPRSVPMAAVFDPGAFDTDETANVVRTLRHGGAYTLVFEGRIASTDALNLASALPLELVFFNTHGSSDAIELAEVVWKKDDLVQQAVLSSSPVVFNSSCTSWRGVGREFVRIGARGYIGTLWPVGSRAAAKLATRVMTQLLDGPSIASTLRTARVDFEIDLAYVYVGTMRDHALTIFRKPTEPPRTGEDLLLSPAGYIAAMLKSQPHASDAIARPWVGLRFLFERLRELFAEMPPNCRDRRAMIAARLDYLDAIRIHGSRLGFAPAYVEELAQDTLTLLTDSDLPEEERVEWRTRFHRARADLRRMFALVEGALEDLRLIGVTSETVLEPEDAINLGELYQTRGDWKLARHLFWRALRLAAKSENRNARMIGHGRLSRLQKRLGNHRLSLRHAEVGLALARDLSDSREQAYFLVDISVALLNLERANDAVQAARQAQEIARLASDVVADLTARGTLSRAMLMAGDTKNARQIAERGLKISIEIGHPYETASFLSSLASVEEAVGDLANAIRLKRNATKMMFDAGRPEVLVGSHVGILALAVRHGDWALIESVAMEFLDTQALLPPAPRGSRMSHFMRILSDALRQEAKRDVCPHLVRVGLHALVRAQAAGNPQDLLVAAEFLGLMKAWLSRADDTLARATSLDQRMPGSGFNWVEFVSGNPPSDTDKPTLR